MKDSDVSVSTDNGVVTLSGTVKSQDQVTIATNLAQRQEGVNRVESQLAVR
jgi:osmotically-inducible protein OsmY